MDAVKYLKEAYRMCETIKNCTICPFKEYKITVPCKFTSESLEQINPEKAVEIVEKWAEEHPAKTRQSEFLKMFPNVRLYGDQIDICPKTVDVKSNLCNEYDCECDKCKKDYWFTEVE